VLQGDRVLQRICAEVAQHSPALVFVDSFRSVVLANAAGDGRHTLGNDFTAAVNRIQALWKARSATPANFRQTLRLCNRWCGDGRCCCARTGTRQKFSSIHDELPLLTSKKQNCESRRQLIATAGIRTA
jgi:hypothetical protein